MPYKVFISYSSKDLSLVARVRDTLKHSSIEVFIAEYSIPPGSSLVQSIISAINDCDIFLLVWSHNSKESDWVHQEVGAAKVANKFVIPVVLDPNMTLPAFIADLKYLPAYENIDDAMAELRNLVLTRVKEREQEQSGAIALLVLLIFLLSFSQEKTGRLVFSKQGTPRGRGRKNKGGASHSHRRSDDS
jgi:TIR domain